MQRPINRRQAIPLHPSQPVIDTVACPLGCHGTLNGDPDLATELFPVTKAIITDPVCATPWRFPGNAAPDCQQPRRAGRCNLEDERFITTTLDIFL